MSIELATAELDCRAIKQSNSFPTECECINLEFLNSIRRVRGESFFPNRIYVRKEMCEVFNELIKKDRDRTQILIGSPGVGKSILLFLVALYRTISEGKSGCFIRRPVGTREPTSVFVMKKKDESGRITIHYSRAVDREIRVNAVLKHALQQHGGIQPAGVIDAILDGDVLIYIDGLLMRDTELTFEFHYLATSGGCDPPRGEAAMTTSVVIMSGWEKEDLGKALESTTDILKRNENAAVPEDRLSEADRNLNRNFRNKTLDRIFYYTGGRIRDAKQYVWNPDKYMYGINHMVQRISPAAVSICFSGSGLSAPESHDRLRTLFRDQQSKSFELGFQIVDSQYTVSLLRDRVGLGMWHQAYLFALSIGQPIAAGIYFEETIHKVFNRCPKPIEKVFRSSEKGQVPPGFLCYWIPFKGFPNIDAAVVIKNSDGSATAWCFQYTLAKKHVFFKPTFQGRFLDPLKKLEVFRDVSMKIKFVYVVPEGVSFTLPEKEAMRNAGYEATTVVVDFSSVEAVYGLFEKLDFIPKPVEFRFLGD